MVLEEGSAMMGRWIYILRAYIKLYERMKYGKAAGYTAHAGIAKATANGTKFLILHSTDDKTISLKNMQTLPTDEGYWLDTGVVNAAN